MPANPLCNTHRLFQLMILKKISILNFKNIREASLELSPNLNCFLGHIGEDTTEADLQKFFMK